MTVALIFVRLLRCGLAQPISSNGWVDKLTRSTLDIEFCAIKIEKLKSDVPAKGSKTQGEVIVTASISGGSHI